VTFRGPTLPIVLLHTFKANAGEIQAVEGRACLDSCRVAQGKLRRTYLPSTCNSLIGLP
jgi:hypothetical protein